MWNTPNTLWCILRSYIDVQCPSDENVGTGWGAGTETLHTAALAIVYSTAEYCAPVWLNSVHFSKINVQLNNAMRNIYGCVKSTQIPWLPTLAHIAPPKLRRKAAAVRELVNCIR
jgi:hypothetical protein